MTVLPRHRAPKESSDLVADFALNARYAKGSDSRRAAGRLKHAIWQKCLLTQESECERLTAALIPHACGRIHTKKSFLGYSVRQGT